MTTILKIMTVLLAITAIPSFASATNARSESIWVGSFSPISSWRAVSRNELLLWSGANKPYLLTLKRPSPQLRFANTIGVSSTAGRVSRFDFVYVDGWRVPIESIQALDKDTAKNLKWRSKKRSDI